MASLNREKQGGREVWRITFYDKNGERRRIRLGDLGKKAAESIRLHVEQLNDCRSANIPINGELSEWLEGIGTELRLE